MLVRHRITTQSSTLLAKSIHPAIYKPATVLPGLRRPGKSSTGSLDAVSLQITPGVTSLLYLGTNALPIQPYAHPAEHKRGRDHSAHPAQQEQRPAHRGLTVQLLQGQARQPSVSHPHG